MAKLSETNIAKVNKTKYKAPKAKGRGGGSKGVIPRRTVIDFASVADESPIEGRRLNQTVRLLTAVYANGYEFGLEGEFPRALPGEFGSYIGSMMIKGELYIRIKLKSGGVYLPDNGKRFEWLD